MRFRTLFLAGAVLPLALSGSALAEQRPAEMRLAQNNAQDCPRGQECPQAEPADAAQQPATQEDALQRAKKRQQQLKKKRQQDGAGGDGGAAASGQDAAPAQDAEQPAAQDETPKPANQQQRKKKRQQDDAAAGASGGAGGEPAGQQQDQSNQPAQGRPEPAPEPQPATEPQSTADDTTVEDQLERQGDREEANRVRRLRNTLIRQMQRSSQGSAGAQSPSGQVQSGQQPPVVDPGAGIDNLYDRPQGGGNVVDRRNGRIIIDLGGGHIYVRPNVPDDGGRLLYGADNIDVQQLPGGGTRTTVYRVGGVQVVTVRNRYGQIVKRTKVLPNGRQIVLIDNRFDPGGAYRPPILRVPPPRVTIPQDRYIVDLGRASRNDLRQALLAPLVQPIERPYTLDEVLRNEPIRAYSPRIDLDTITFDFGSATIGNDQMQTLYELGQAMEEVIRDNPDEVYLVEGHTDAVGSDYDNLILSDRRAEAVAVALSQNFAIPPENLVTEGYGEQYLKVPTEAAERLNRRAAVRRLTDLLQAQN